MKTLLFAALAMMVTACGPRKVEVKTGPQPASEVSLSVTNNLSSPVNVYVITGGNEVFIKQVPANTTESMNVPGVAAGTTVKLKATPVGGSSSYTRDNVTLSGLYEWRVP
jgi:hypothetical protein